MNGQEIVTIADHWLGVAVTLGVGGVWLRKRLPSIKKAEQFVAPLIDDGVHLFKDLVKTPWFAGVAATTELKVHHVVSKLEDTTLGQVVAKWLGAFGTHLDSMTDIQKVNLIQGIKAEMAQFNVTVTNDQVNAMLKLVQAGVDKIRADVLPTVQKQEETYQSIKQVSSPITQVAE